MSDEVEKHDNFPNKVEYTIQLGKSSINTKIRCMMILIQLVDNLVFIVMFSNI